MDNIKEFTDLEAVAVEPEAPVGSEPGEVVPASTV